MLPTVVRNRGLRPLARNLVLLKHSLELLANLSGRTCLLTSPLNHHIDVVEQVQHSHVSGVKDLLVVHPGPPTAYVPVGAIVLDALFAAQVEGAPGPAPLTTGCGQRMPRERVLPAHQITPRPNFCK